MVLKNIGLQKRLVRARVQPPSGAGTPIGPRLFDRSPFSRPFSKRPKTYEEHGVESKRTFFVRSRQAAESPLVRCLCPTKIVSHPCRWCSFDAAISNIFRGLRGRLFRSAPDLAATAEVAKRRRPSDWCQPTICTIRHIVMALRCEPAQP